MAGVTACVDILYRIDSVLRDLRKHITLAQKTPKVAIVDPEVEKLSEDLVIQKTLYGEILFQLFQKRTISAMKGEELAGLEEKARKHLKPQFRQFMTTVELLGNQIGKIAALLGLDDRVDIDVQKVVISGGPRDDVDSSADTSAPTSRVSDLPQSQQRLRGILEADIAVSYIPTQLFKLREAFLTD